METNYVVYIHENKVNHKKYIGVTKQSLQKRFRNGEGQKRCPKFYRAIQKYGWDNCTHTVYMAGLTGEEADAIEKELISKYDTINNGYNISAGGRFGIAISPEDIAKNNKEGWTSGRYDSIKNKVYCVELDTYYESALEAKRQLKIDDSSIQKACCGKLNYAGVIDYKPMHWLFAQDVTPQRVQELKNRKEQIKGRGLPVYCKELDKIYPSAAKAGAELSLDPSSIRKAARGIAKTCGQHPITGQRLHWTNVYEQ